MRVRTLVDLLTLSTNVYMLSKDQEFMKNFTEMANKGKQKFDKFMEDITTETETGNDSENVGAASNGNGKGTVIMEKLMQKAKEAKEELEEKMEEVAKKVYAKMHIAHTEQVDELNKEIETLKKELALAESRIVSLETTSKHHK